MAVVHQQLHRTVIVEIGSGDTMTVERLGDPRTGIDGDVFEPAIVSVPVKQLAFIMVAAKTLGFHPPRRPETSNAPKPRSGGPALSAIQKATASNEMRRVKKTSAKPPGAFYAPLRRCRGCF